MKYGLTFLAGVIVGAALVIAAGLFMGRQIAVTPELPGASLTEDDAPSDNG
ncbi:hypothetical protein ACFELO_00200 [Oceanicaulis sp. LC35]|uniref:hypothetical protein n=1 Tax=Oceanicaulis sp. LC35 TaxID=3349635 RepID=UPI003F82D014